MPDCAFEIHDIELQKFKHNELLKLFTKESPIIALGLTAKPKINYISIYSEHPEYNEYKKKILDIDNECVIYECKF